MKASWRSLNYPLSFFTFWSFCWITIILGVSLAPLSKLFILYAFFSTSPQRFYVLTFPFLCCMHLTHHPLRPTLWLRPAECVLARVALTGPDNSRSAFICQCQPLHLWAAQSRGELAALFVLSPSGDGPATKESLQVYRSQAVSSLSHKSSKIPAHIACTYMLSPTFCACM